MAASCRVSGDSFFTCRRSVTVGLGPAAGLHDFVPVHLSMAATQWDPNLGSSGSLSRTFSRLPGAVLLTAPSPGLWIFCLNGTATPTRSHLHTLTALYMLTQPLTHNP